MIIINNWKKCIVIKHSSFFIHRNSLFLSYIVFYEEYKDIVFYVAKCTAALAQFQFLSKSTQNTKIPLYLCFSNNILLFSFNDIFLRNQTILLYLWILHFIPEESKRIKLGSIEEPQPDELENLVREDVRVRIYKNPTIQQQNRRIRA